MSLSCIFMKFFFVYACAWSKEQMPSDKGKTINLDLCLKHLTLCRFKNLAVFMFIKQSEEVKCEDTYWVDQHLKVGL